MNYEQVDILEQNPGYWNTWLQDRPDIQIDLEDADLSETDLSDCNLSDAILTHANLSAADLSHTNLTDANLLGANLDGADLSRSYLIGANLSSTSMEGTNLRSALVWETVFADIDLRQVKGLAEIKHNGPSHIALSTVQLPQDGSALHFLRGAGISDEWIDFYCATMMSPVQYYSCFISYSNQDEILARRLHADLQAQGVRCWFAPEDLKIGDKFRSRIDEAIHVHEKLLLILSDAAVESTWVESEVEAALEREKRQRREVLFPIRIDERVLTTSQAWAANLRRTRHIGDFTRWAEPEAYQVAFERLLRDLKKADVQE